jgi:DNA-directed RNA polymerase specialized sigma subunit
MSLRNTLLNEQEELVIRLRDEEKLTFREIAARLDLSTSRMGQIYHAATPKSHLPPTVFP